MSAVARRRVSLPSIADAVVALEVDVGRLLLAVQEEGVGGGSVARELDRLRQRWAELQEMRDLLRDMAAEGGRPCLTVLTGGCR